MKVVVDLLSVIPSPISPIAEIISEGLTLLDIESAEEVGDLIRHTANYIKIKSS